MRTTPLPAWSNRRCDRHEHRPTAVRYGFTLTRLQYIYRRVIGMHFTRHQHIVLQFIIQRAKLLSHDVNPAPHRIAVQLHALAGIDF